MKMALLTILVGISCLAAEAVDGEAPLAIVVAIPKKSDERRVEYHDRNAHFHVIVSNTSDKPQRLWEEWCSWGYYGLTFEFRDQHGKKWVAKKKPRDWTMNFPSWWSLDPHESFVVNVDFGDADVWQGFPMPENGSQTVTMEAILEFKSDDQSRKHGVWTGRITSKPGEFTFYRWKPEARDYIHEELSELEGVAFQHGQTNIALDRLRVLWRERDPLRRPLVANLMCQLGDRRFVSEVADAFFAGAYDTGRSIQPDGSAAGANATDAAFRMLILYGTPQHQQKLVQFLSLREDPLRKGAELCGVLLGLSSTNEGRGLPIGYSKQKFPLDLAIRCLDYTQQVGTVVYVADGSWHPERGCDRAAQTVQNITGRDFGHSKRAPVRERDLAIDAIRKWWMTARASSPNAK